MDIGQPRPRQTLRGAAAPPGPVDRSEPPPAHRPSFEHRDAIARIRASKSS